MNLLRFVGGKPAFQTASENAQLVELNGLQHFTVSALDGLQQLHTAAIVSSAQRPLVVHAAGEEFTVDTDGQQASVVPCVNTVVSNSWTRI